MNCPVALFVLKIFFILFKANVRFCYAIFDRVNRSDLTSSQQWCSEHFN